MRGVRFLFEMILVGWLLLVAACGVGLTVDRGPTEGGAGGSSTTSTGEGGTGEGGIFDTTSSTGGEGGGPVCEGECYLWKSALFEDLSMFWIGPPGEAPPCPAEAPFVGAIGHADLLDSSHTCPTCSCSPAGCVLPEHMYVSAATCPGDGAPSIGWDAPGWDGACSPDGAIPPGLMCSGVPCAQSLTIAAPTVGPCEPITEGEAPDPPDPVWGLVAQECIIGPLSGEGCPVTGQACVDPPPQGFSLCLYRYADDLKPEDCPAEYPRYLRMHAGHDDDRACAPCACSDPQGGACTAVISAFSVAACGGFLGAYTVTSAMNDACFDLPAGVGLGSKAGVLTVDEPGSCTASGGPVGGITPTLPITLCCQEPPPPPAK